MFAPSSPLLKLIKNKYDHIQQTRGGEEDNHKSYTLSFWLYSLAFNNSSVTLMTNQPKEQVLKEERREEPNYSPECSDKYCHCHRSTSTTRREVLEEAEEIVESIRRGADGAGGMLYVSHEDIDKALSSLQSLKDK